MFKKKMPILFVILPLLCTNEFPPSLTIGKNCLPLRIIQLIPMNSNSLPNIIQLFISTKLYLYEQ